MEARHFIELAALAVVAIAVVAVVFQRVKVNKGIGIRAIQFVAIPSLLSVLVILGLENLLEKSTIAAILAGIAGYVFAKPSVQKEGDED